MLREGKTMADIQQLIHRKCEHEQVVLEYLELANTLDLTIQHVPGAHSILLIAGYVDEIRLIDNLLLDETSVM